MLSFINVLRAEVYKTKRTWTVWLGLLLPLLVTFIIFGVFFNDARKGGVFGNNVWQGYTSYILGFYYLLYPLYAMLAAYSINNIEYKNNSFKDVFTFPAPRAYFYLGKVAVLFFWMLLSVVFAYGILLLSGNLLGNMYSSIGFQDFDIRPLINMVFAKLFINMLCISAIHFVLSLLFDSLLLSFGLGFFMVIFGSIVASKDWSYAMPYSGFMKAMTAFNTNVQVILTKEVYWSIGWMVMVLLVGWVLITRKSIK